MVREDFQNKWKRVSYLSNIVWWRKNVKSPLKLDARSNANFKPISIASPVSVGNGRAKREKNLFQGMRTIFP
jgi:hypothetical protein